MLKIVHIPNKVLVSPVEKVATIDDKIKKLVFDMEEALIAQVDPQGVGLAAPQVGVSLSLFIIKPSPKQSTEVFINPKILEVVETKISKKPVKKSDDDQPSEKEETKLEGCLSIPKIWSPVKRAKKVLIEYQDLTGEKKKEWVGGFKAVILQHEVDHLNGILFTQRALEQGSQLYEEKDGELFKVEIGG